MRVKLRGEGGEVETIALVNSGFETDTPDIMVPLALARRLDLLELASVDRPDKSVRVNAIISRHVDEVLLSDYVAGELGIVVLDFKRGLWRFSDEEVVRRSEPRRS